MGARLEDVAEKENRVVIGRAAELGESGKEKCGGYQTGDDEIGRAHV